MNAIILTLSFVLVATAYGLEDINVEPEAKRLEENATLEQNISNHKEMDDIRSNDTNPTNRLSKNFDNIKMTDQKLTPKLLNKKKFLLPNSAQTTKIVIATSASLQKALDNRAWRFADKNHKNSFKGVFSKIEEDEEKQKQKFSTNFSKESNLSSGYDKTTTKGALPLLEKPSFKDQEEKIASEIHVSRNLYQSMIDNNLTDNTKLEDRNENVITMGTLIKEVLNNLNKNFWNNLQNNDVNLAPIKLTTESSVADFLTKNVNSNTVSSKLLKSTNETLSETFLQLRSNLPKGQEASFSSNNDYYNESFMENIKDIIDTIPHHLINGNGKNLFSLLFNNVINALAKRFNITTAVRNVIRYLYDVLGNKSLFGTILLFAGVVLTVHFGLFGLFLATNVIVPLVSFVFLLLPSNVTLKLFATVARLIKEKFYAKYIQQNS